ncbi:bifunctional phosphoribosylaminoimidazole carboxylase/phosphoribosylaminoimidazole succinocarboxamide synthetase [Nerophis lumbriciformis]|uniref:bifunctional phosphoribosylaminoimidazole carboxylase/phosphoribosylaminoimidazole succinocarboxamide synthetase n=1 Tax=Nerophis lumbriciformis TaxID=546530 RepID=UPI003BA9EECB
MERGAEKQRGQEEEEEEGGSTERPWGDVEVLALVSAWDEVVAQHGAQSRVTFQLISERLRRLSVVRSWRDCRAKCRSLRLDSTRPPADGRTMEGTDQQRGIPSAHTQEGVKTQVSVAEEGGRHWTDDEVRALLCVWADGRVRDRLKSTLRNKFIFQEMSRHMQRTFGVVRNWKQCRTKYKNLKYDYKTAKSAHEGDGSSGSSGAGKYMKFYDEVEAILMDRGLNDMSLEVKGKLFDGEKTEKSEGEVVIEIDDDDNSDDCDEDGDTDPKWKGQDMPSSGQFHVVTVSDTGRNWSDQEVRALIRVWSDDRVRLQLESSTRKRDIFVQISNRLMQQGIERDWKQCHTKYKNLKYLYRSLQKGKPDEGDPRRLMRFYDEVDAIMNRRATDHQADLGPVSMLEILEDISSTKADMVTDMEEKTCSSDSLSPIGITAMPKEEKGIQTESSHHLELQHRLTGSCVDSRAHVDLINRGRKRKAEDEDDTFPTPLKRIDCGNMTIKEESDHIPIIDVHSICSMASKEAPPKTQVHVFGGGRKPEYPEGTHAVTGRTCKLHHKNDATSYTRLRSDYHAAFTYLCCSATNPRVRTWATSSCVGHSPAATQPNTPHSSPMPFSSNSILSFHGASTRTMAPKQELSIGKKLNEGKTKQIFEILDQPGLVLVQSKDQITAGNAARKDQMEGKAAIANKTTSCVFKLLQEAGIKTAFVKQHSDTAFIAAHCEMIPIEWVCRRVATGSFLKRNPGVKEGYRFSPLKMEMFFKDDANNDPQWSEEQILEAKFLLGGLTIGKCEVDVMNRSTVAIFEILEKSWATQNCTLVDMKIEFGVNVKTQEIVLADVIDNDSWRLWPAGDRSQQKDKQVYRDLKEVTPEAMQMVKRNFEWVSERVKLLLESQAGGRVVVLMGSTSDLAHCEKIKKACGSYGVPCVLRVTSAHKGPDETLRIKAEYEGDGVPTVFVAVAGRSNGLGPVMSGNTAYPVINCPPLTPDWGSQDVWSSLRMPSGLGCPTILSPEAAAQFAAQVFGLTNHLVWCKLRASMLNTWVALKVADKKLQACSI